MLENIENLRHLNFKFEYQKRLIHAFFDNNEHFSFKTPLLKVLKPIHKSFNKKKNTERKYIILEVSENYESYNELDDFIITINKLHEISQENIRVNSIKWFNTEFDDIGLDMKVKKPIEHQKNKQFIKIIIPDNELLLEKIQDLEKDDYISPHLQFKGLKVYSEYLVEEYELLDFLTEDEMNEHFTEEDIDIESNIQLDNPIKNHSSHLEENKEDDSKDNENDKPMVESKENEEDKVMVESKENDEDKVMIESKENDQDEFMVESKENDEDEVMVESKENEEDKPMVESKENDEDESIVESKEIEEKNEIINIDINSLDKTIENNQEFNKIDQNESIEVSNEKIHKKKFIKLVRRPKKKLLFIN